MKIITCYKCVPDEQDIAINNADGTLDFSKADSKISQYDLNAIEAACQLKQQLGDAQVVAMSVGGKALTNAKGRKDVLSRGPDELIVVIDDQFEQALPQHTATALAAAAQKSGFDLLICGDGSSDLYAQQVGLLVGEALNIPAINGVSKILSLTDSTLTVERELEDEVETLSIPLPAVIAVSTDINTPQIPSMKAILGAAKKPVQVWSPADIGLNSVPTYSAQQVAAPKQRERQRVVIEGDGEEQIAAFVENLRKIILLSGDVMNKFSSVWVFSDTPSRLPELMSGAQAVGEKVNAFVLNEADSATACHLGADHVWLLSGKPEDRMIEDYAAAMAETIRQHSEGGAVLLPNTRRGKLLAAKLGYRLSAAVSNDASEVALQDGKAAVKHMVYGGLAIGAETIASPFAVITLSSGTFDAQDPDTSRSGEMHTVQWQAPAITVTRTATQARQSNSVDLDKARLVVSVGRGIGSKENISLAEALCQTIGAELACSRPVAENEKWMEHERYVGISNLMLKPELYLAVGISGQIQHMVGANGAQTIFAINKDKNAPIFQYADFGIVGDALKILPALTAALAR